MAGPTRQQDLRLAAEGSFGHHALLAVAVPVCDAHALEQLAREMGLELLTLDELAGRVVQHGPNGRPLAVELSSIVVGVVSLSPTGREDVLAQTGTLSAFFSLLDYAHLHLDGPSNLPEAASWCAARLASLCAVLASDAFQMRRSLSLLRKEHEQNLEHFAQLEAVTTSLVTPERVLKLEYPESQAHVVLAPAGSGQSAILQQVFPVSPTGVSAIELKVVARRIDDPGVLQVTLRVLGEEEPACRWSLPAANLSLGSLPLRLEAGLPYRGMGLLLEVIWSGGATELRLALSHPTPLDEFAVRFLDGCHVGAPLAAKVWAGLPNVRAEEREMLSPKVSAGAAAQLVSGRFALTSDDFRRIKPLDAATLEEAGFNVVEYRSDSRDVIVHPFEDKATSAIVADLHLGNIVGLSALVLIDNINSAPVAFGLALVPHAEPGPPRPEDCIEQWTLVTPMQYTEISGTVASGLAGDTDLILATRMPEGVSSDQAWAVFKRIEFISVVEDVRNL